MNILIMYVRNPTPN